MTRALPLPAGKESEQRFPSGTPVHAQRTVSPAHPRAARIISDLPLQATASTSEPAVRIPFSDIGDIDATATLDADNDAGSDTQGPEHLPFLHRRPSTVERVDASDLLARSEVSRMRFLAIFIFMIAPIGLFALHFSPVQGLAADIHRVGILFVLGVAIWFYRRVRTPADYTTARSLFFGHACVIGLASGFYHWGIFSAFLMVLPFGGLLINQSRSQLMSMSVSLSAAVLYSVMALLVIGGVVGDNGLTRGATGETSAQFVGFLAVLGVMITSAVVARLARKASNRLLEERDEALAELSHREAQLIEARQELAEAQHVRGPGRYTDRLIGDYLLGEVIGRGAMSEVYEAAHRATGCAAAVKLLHPHVLATPEHFRRFIREARIVAALDEPHIVRVLELSRGSETLPYIAMELLEGETLSRYLKRVSPMPLAEVVDMVRQIGRGLAAAHAAGIVHRDLKPQNLYRTEDANGRAIWKILDFGVCKLVEPQDQETQLGRLIGTPAYMAPEQACGRQVDRLTDMYTLGIVAYRALTGRPAFAGKGVDRVLYDIVFRHPPRPSAVCGLPGQIDLVFALALAKQPNLRFASGEALADALVAAACGALQPQQHKLAEHLLADGRTRDPSEAELAADQPARRETPPPHGSTTSAETAVSAYRPLAGMPSV